MTTLTPSGRLAGAAFVARVPIYGKPGRFYAVAGRVADAGQTCERVDPESLPWLLEQGYIAPKGQE